MRKIAGNAETKQMLAPENVIKVSHMDAKKHMPATSRIPVSRAVWAELTMLKKPGKLLIIS